MRYFTYCYPSRDDPSIPIIEKVSEEEIRQEYFPYWQRRVKEVHGEDYYRERNFTFEDCLQDWIDSHWAVEVKES